MPLPIQIEAFTLRMEPFLGNYTFISIASRFARVSAT
jgi:hypothetical protein